MLIKKNFKNKKNFFIVSFLNGQFFVSHIGIFINKLIKVFQRPKYDFIIN